MVMIVTLTILFITIMPSIYSTNPSYRRDALFLNDPPFWEGTATLIRNATFTVTGHTSGKTYTVSSTTALGALNSASRQGDFSYTISDQWYEQYGSLLVYSIAGKKGEGFDGWQYWVNYPHESIPYVGADQYQVTEGDIVDFFYGGYGVNPNTASMLIRIYIHIEHDTSPPVIDIVRPTEGIYILDREIITLPIDLTIILGEINIVAETTDEQTSVDKVEFFIDYHEYAIDEEYPYEWSWDETSIGKYTLSVVAYDVVGNHGSEERILWILST